MTDNYGLNSFQTWLDFSTTEAGKKLLNNKKASKKKGSNSKWLKKVDGQDEDGQGGGRLSKASDVFSKLAKNTPGSVHRTAEYNKGIESSAGATENPWEVTGEYSGIKTGQGQQTTLLRDLETETKKKRNRTG